jgi:hypothetical protein
LRLSEIQPVQVQRRSGFLDFQLDFYALLDWSCVFIAAARRLVIVFLLQQSRFKHWLMRGPTVAERSRIRLPPLREQAQRRAEMRLRKQAARLGFHLLPIPATGE